MKKTWVTLRRSVQLSFLLLFIILLWRSIYPVQGTFGAMIFFAFDPLIASGVSISDRVFLGILIPSALFVIITLFAGRFFCGWICPMGTMIDIGGRLRKILIKNIKKEYYTAGMRYFKFFLLAIIMLLAVFGLQILWWFDPITIAGRFVSMNLIPLIVRLNDIFFRNIAALFGYPDAVMGLYRYITGLIGGVRIDFFSNVLGILGVWLFVILLTVIARRFWCRSICPLGAVYALFSSKPLLRRRVDKDCSDCKICIPDCRMKAIQSSRDYMPGECILCMDCLYSCPKGSAGFSFKRNRQ